MFLRLHTDFGFSVVPCYPGAKRPWLETWTDYQTKRPTLDQVAEWSAVYERWGIITGGVSGVVIVDTDNPEAEEWAKQNLPETPWVVLAGRRDDGFRGVHRYYRHPLDGARYPNRARIKVAPGQKIALDVRADGGFVVGPGSPHESGVTYEPTRQWDPAEIATLPVYDPSWWPVVEELPQHPLRSEPINRSPSADSGKRTAPYNRASEWILRREPAIEGQGGDQHTFLTACNLLEFGITQDEAWSLLVDWNETCQPPWSEKGLRSKLNNALRFGGKYSKENKELPTESLDWLETLEVPWDQRPHSENLGRLKGVFGLKPFTAGQAAEVLIGEGNKGSATKIGPWLKAQVDQGTLIFKRGIQRTYQFGGSARFRKEAQMELEVSCDQSNMTPSGPDQGVMRCHELEYMTPSGPNMTPHDTSKGVMYSSSEVSQGVMFDSQHDTLVEASENLDWLETLGQASTNEPSLGQAQTAQILIFAPPKPIVSLNGDLNREMEDTADAVQRINDPPFIFARDTEIIRVLPALADQRGAVIQPITEKLFKAILTQRIRFQRKKKKDEDTWIVTESSPSPELIASIHSANEVLNLPQLRRVTALPVMDYEGNVRTQPGYDPNTKTIYEPALGVTVPPIPETITPMHGAEAVKLFRDEMLVDFKFAKDGLSWDGEACSASLANTIALMLEPTARSQMKPGSVSPLAMIQASRRNAGKSKLARSAILVGTGARPDDLNPPEKDNNVEWSKELTKCLNSAAEAVLADNMRGHALDNQMLDRLLTSPSFSPREFFAQRSLTLTNNKTWVATGNNLELHEDTARRCYYIKIHHQPEDREAFKNGEIEEWTAANLGRMAWAVRVLVRGWIQAGRPLWKTLRPETCMGKDGSPRRFDSFESWADVLGGILDWAGIEGFMTNYKAAQSRAAFDDQEANDFFEFLSEKFKDRVEFTAAEAALLLRTMDRYGKTVDYLGNTIRIEEGQLLSSRSVVTKMGKWLNGHVEQSRRGVHMYYRQGRNGRVYWVARDAEPAEPAEPRGTSFRGGSASAKPYDSSLEHPVCGTAEPFSDPPCMRAREELDQEKYIQGELGFCIKGERFREVPQAPPDPAPWDRLLGPGVRPLKKPSYARDGMILVETNQGPRKYPEEMFEIFHVWDQEVKRGGHGDE
jgi:hypothetical protein